MGNATTLRDASVYEDSNFKYIDINYPYYKINNDSSVALRTNLLATKVGLILSTTNGNDGRFNIKLNNT